MKFFFLLAEILLTSAGFCIGTLGQTDFVGALVTPDAHASSTALRALEQGHPVTPGTPGFATLARAALAYCKDYRLRPDCTQVISRFENRRNFVNELVSHAKLKSGGELTLGFRSFRPTLDAIASQARLPIAVIFFLSGILLMIGQYVWNRRSAEQCAAAIA